MSTADIISAIGVTATVVSVFFNFLQYRGSRSRNRTETSRRIAQHQNLIDLAARAAAQAETVKLIANGAVRGAPVNVEDLRILSGASAKLAEELSAEAEDSRGPARSRRRYRFVR
jgi:hypothetical protein